MLTRTLHSLQTHRLAWPPLPQWLSVNPLLLPTALLLHRGTPTPGVVEVEVEVEVAEIRRTKTPYKLAWMPFVEDRYTLPQNPTPTIQDRHYVSSDLDEGITPALVLLF